MFELEDYNADVLPDEKQKNKQKQKKTISNHLFLSILASVTAISRFTSGSDQHCTTLMLHKQNV